MRWSRSLHRVFRSPFSGRAIVSGSVSLEDVGNIWNQWIIGVGVGEKTADRKENLADCQCRRPLVLQNVQTDTSIRVDVAVIDTSGEVNLRRLEWIVRREVDIEEEDTSGIGRVIWSHDCCLPMKHIVSNGARGTVGRWVLTQIDEF